MFLAYHLPLISYPLLLTGLPLLAEPRLLVALLSFLPQAPYPLQLVSLVVSYSAEAGQLQTSL